jgi:hypothetical protein
MSGGEAGEKRLGGSTRARACRMIERNHGQLQLSWLWPADRLGSSPGDPRYFTHVGRVVLIKLGWARPTKAPSHICGV